MLYNRLQSNPSDVLNLPSVKQFLTKVEARPTAQKDGLRYYYQDVRLNRFKVAKTALVSSCVKILKSISDCFTARYGSLGSSDPHAQTDSTSAREGDTIIYHACKVLNTKTWYVPNDETQETALSGIIESINFLFENFKDMNAFRDVSLDNLKDEYVCLVEYTLRYFDVNEIDCMQLWSKLKKLDMANRWKNAFLLVELCLCSPYSNATVERLFSQMKVVKTDWRNRLNERNFEDLLRIKISDVNFLDFSAR
jgi:hypothetical protein